MKIYHLTNITPSQMLGMIIQTDNGKVIAIDGGTELQPDELYRVLKMVGLKVDMWFMTHPHYDHFGSIVEVLKNHDDIEVGGIWHSTVEQREDEHLKADDFWYPFLKETDIPVHELEMDEQFTVDNLTIDVLGIANPEVSKDVEYINNQSIVLKISDGDFKLLILGDLAVEGGEKLLRNHRNDIQCDAVQMAHHGQKGVDKTVYEAIGATYAFWPTPTWLWENRWPTSTEPDLKDLKTFEVRKWAEDLGMININAFEHSIVFDTHTKTVKEI